MAIRTIVVNTIFKRMIDSVEDSKNNKRLLPITTILTAQITKNRVFKNFKKQLYERQNGQMNNKTIFLK